MWTVGYTNRQREYPGNKIKTTKYTWATFVPKNLWEQMHKFGNIYFMFISFLMYLGQYTSLFVGSINYLSTLSVLVMMMMVTAAMALLDDLSRGRADNEVNRREATVVVDGRRVTKLWEEIQVSDLLVVAKHEELPADVVILYSTGSEGTCYVSTANLDGETNLKLKSAVPTMQARLGEAGADGVLDKVLDRTQQTFGVIEAEAPQASIYDFSGVLRSRRTSAAGRRGSLGGGTPLQAGQLLLRGTTLKLTEWVVGVVVYTGPETRMVMNSREVPPMKRSTLEAVTNRAMLIVLATQGLLAAFSSACSVLNRGTIQAHWYLELPTLILPDVLAYWCTFFVLYSNMMPISLYPTLEFCHAAHSYFVRNDREMACKDLQFAAGVRSSNLTEELGQVSYVFSDKTGTLTQNVMEVKRLSVAGAAYGTLVEGEKGFNGKGDLLQARDWKSVSSLLEVLAVAHTAMAIQGPGGQVSYEAESPDEVALVSAAARVGLVFRSRVGNVVEVADTTGRGHDRRYKILAVNAFDSTRKRMSVVVERDGQFHILAKGADNVMLDGSVGAKDVLEAHLGEFARQGLRTLVFARRQLEPREAEAWLRTYEAAERDVANRKRALTDAAVEIEKKLEVVGASAIEDKLQIGVPAAVRQIRDAGIKLWVLTGDKLETARSIGFSSGVLTGDMQVEVLDTGVPLEDLEGRVARGARGREVGLMVTGGAFTALQSEGPRERFLEVAKKCSVLIACRISPAQKADIVRIVCEGIQPRPVTLAIGDGANDVPMIQEAQIGVGVAGLEGCQAVNSSDFSVGQFRFLTRLLLVHGHWNYRRMCKVTMFTFWRNAVQVLCIFFYTPVSAFSGSVLFEDYLRISFNPLGSIPVIATGCFDQDVRDCVLLGHPHFYKIGREGQDFNNKRLMLSTCDAAVHAAVLISVAYLAFPHMAAQGAGDYYTFGTMVYSCLLLDLLCRLNFLSSTRNWPVAGLIVATFLMYMVYLVIYPCSRFLTDLLAPSMYMVPAHMVSSLAFWLCLLAAPTLNQLFDLFTFFLWKTFDEDLRDLESKRREHATKSCKSCRSRRAYRAICEEDSTDSDESAMEGIATTRIAQQSYLGWTPPHIHGSCLLGLLAVVGTLLMAAGWASYRASRQAGQMRIHYEGAGNGDPMGTDAQTEVFEACRGGAAPCNVRVTVPSSMARPILVHYTVSPFYQNFNDYLCSVVPRELRGELVTPEMRAEECPEKTRVTGDGREIVPCGMQATSLFNDSFTISSAPISTDGIAWASDKERYNNPPDYPGRPNTSWLFNRYPRVVDMTEGVKNDHFIAWMRPSAMACAWKQYGWLERDLEEGEELSIRIQNNFDVSRFNGSKQLVITEVGPLGGRADGLGAFLLACGVGCYIFGAIAMVVGKIGEEMMDSAESSDGEDSDASAREVLRHPRDPAGSDFQNDEAESSGSESSDSRAWCRR